MDTRSPQPAAPSLAALFGGIMHDAEDLLIQELTLATLAGHEELRHCIAKRGVVRKRKARETAVASTTERE